MTLIQTVDPKRIILRVSKQGVCSAGDLSSVFEKTARELKLKPKPILLKCKNSLLSDI